MGEMLIKTAEDKRQVKFIKPQVYNTMRYYGINSAEMHSSDDTVNSPLWSKLEDKSSSYCYKDIFKCACILCKHCTYRTLYPCMILKVCDCELCMCTCFCVSKNWSTVLEQQGLGQFQDVQVGIQGPAQALEHHDGKHNGRKVTLQLHLEQQTVLNHCKM